LIASADRLCRSDGEHRWAILRKGRDPDGLVAVDLVEIDPFARQLSPRNDRSISWRTATIGAWLPRIEIAAAPA
jgi:hypothetical protein